ncbi:MAG: tyrosine-type recombinase/integrase [Sphingobacteriaceae bacterium]
MRSFNAYLDGLQTKVYDAHKAITDAGSDVTAKSIKNKFLGVADESRMLLEVFRDHNQKMAALVDNEFAPGTLLRYETLLKHTRNFLEWKYKLHDIDIRKIDHHFITEFEFYLRSVRKCANNTAVKYVRNFGKILRICIANRWITYDPFLNYRSKIKTVDRVFLTAEELQEMSNKTFAMDRLTQVRDVFMFCCFTGLAYTDVKQLRRIDLITGVDGEQWISIRRQKTDTPARIPLLPAAHKLIDRYIDHPHCGNTGRVLPVLSNSKNECLLKRDS